MDAEAAGLRGELDEERSFRQRLEAMLSTAEMVRK